MPHKIVKAFELLSDPAKWTQKDFAKDECGRRVSPLSEHARSWCMVGAIEKLYPDDGVSVYEAVRAVSGYKFGLFRFNDTHTHAEVLELLRKADV